MNFRISVHCVVASVLAVAASTAAAEYSDKPVRLIVPFAAGGTTDLLARVITEQMPLVFGQPMVIDNKAGAGGMLGAIEISKAVANGYTLGLATVSTTAGVPALNPNVSYDPTTDFTSIMNIAATPNVLAIHPSLPVRDFRAFIALARSRPVKFSFASSGTGGISHPQIELFKSLTGVVVPHIPYRGADPALAGQVPVIFDNLPSTLPFIKEKRLIAIAVAAPERLPLLPDVPTFKELGHEPVNRMAYYCLNGPKNLPYPVVVKVHMAVKKMLEDPGVRQRIEQTGSIIVGNMPEQFSALMRTEYAVYKRVVEQQKLKIQ
ncbi:MAG: tripartite tricarboxylate transporter substrate-binding protein [Rhizobacter sp.]